MLWCCAGLLWWVVCLFAHVSFVGGFVAFAPLFGCAGGVFGSFFGSLCLGVSGFLWCFLGILVGGFCVFDFLVSLSVNDLMFLLLFLFAPLPSGEVECSLIYRKKRVIF